MYNIFGIIITIFVIGMTIWIYKQRKPINKKVYFIGPHCSGKTESIVGILGLNNTTVSSLTNHSIIKDGIQIEELPPRNDECDFEKRFWLETGKKYLFFVKNEEEVDEYPNFEDYNVKYVYWRKSNGKNKKIIYLEESIENLIGIIKNF